MKLNENLFEDYSEPTDFSYKIKYQLDDKVNEIFTYFQNIFGIESGDIEPMLSLELEEAEENLSDVIKKGLYTQLGYYTDEYDESLNESSKYDARYEVRSYYDRRYRGLEDDLYTNDFEEVKDWVWEKGQQHFIEVFDHKTRKSVRLDTESYDWESDDAYRVLDDLDELSPLHDSFNEPI